MKCRRRRSDWDKSHFMRMNEWFAKVFAIAFNVDSLRLSRCRTMIPKLWDTAMLLFFSFVLKLEYNTHFWTHQMHLDQILCILFDFQNKFELSTVLRMAKSPGNDCLLVRNSNIKCTKYGHSKFKIRKSNLQNSDKQPERVCLEVNQTSINEMNLIRIWLSTVCTTWNPYSTVSIRHLNYSRSKTIQITQKNLSFSAILRFDLIDRKAPRIETNAIGAITVHFA